jgi:hypothetical protein
MAAREREGARVAQVRLVEVSKRWGAEPAVDRVSFTADKLLWRCAPEPRLDVGLGETTSWPSL